MNLNRPLKEIKTGHKVDLKGLIKQDGHAPVQYEHTLVNQTKI